MINYYADLISMMRREIVRTVRKFHKPNRIGLVSSYDKTRHAVKVKFQPTGTESGWIPLTAIAVGNGFGVLSAPNINDQVEVSYQEGEHMVGRVVARHFSTIDQPPQINSGEHIIVHELGAQLYFKQDGTLVLNGAGTVQTGPVGGGQSGDLTTGSQTGETGQMQQGQQQQQPTAQQTIIFNPDGTLEILAPNNNITVNGGQSINVTGTNTVNITATTEDVNITAQSEQGGVNVTSEAANVVITAAKGIGLTSPVVVYSGALAPGALADQGQAPSAGTVIGSVPSGIG